MNFLNYRKTWIGNPVLQQNNTNNPLTINVIGTEITLATSPGSTALVQHELVDGQQTAIQCKANSPIIIENSENITTLLLDNTTIASIQNLPAGLQNLVLQNTGLTSFDPSILPQGLQYLFLSGNELTSLQLSDLPDSLLFLDLGSNQFTAIDVALLPRNLQSLAANDNLLISFETSQLPDYLTYLNLQGNQLTDLAVSQLPDSLDILYCQQNKLSSLDNFQSTSLLKTIQMEDNELLSFSTVLPSTLETLGLQRNQLASFDVSTLPESIKTLSLNNNNISTFDATNLPVANLESFIVGGNPFMNDETAALAFANSLPTVTNSPVLGLSNSDTQATTIKPIAESKGWTVSI